MALFNHVIPHIMCFCRIRIRNVGRSVKDIQVTKLCNLDSAVVWDSLSWQRSRRDSCGLGLWFQIPCDLWFGALRSGARLRTLDDTPDAAAVTPRLTPNKNGTQYVQVPPGTPPSRLEGPPSGSRKTSLGIEYTLSGRAPVARRLTVSLAQGLQKDATAPGSSAAVACLTKSSLLASPVHSGVSQFDQAYQALCSQVLRLPAKVAESPAKASQQASPLSSASVGKLKQVALEQVRVSATDSATNSNQQQQIQQQEHRGSACWKSAQASWPLINAEHLLHSSPRPDFACRSFVCSTKLSGKRSRFWLGLTRIAPGHLGLLKLGFLQK